MDDDTYVYENSGVLPRVFVVPRVVAVTSEDQAYVCLRAASAKEFRETVVVEGLKDAPPADEGDHPVRFVSYGATRSNWRSAVRVRAYSSSRRPGRRVGGRKSTESRRRCFPHGGLFKRFSFNDRRIASSYR